VTLPDRLHEISVVCDGRVVRGWSSYEISNSMLDPADRFSMEVPFSREAWQLLRQGRPIKIRIDDVVVMSGYIDDREIPEGGGEDVIQISGFDKSGRLVQESAPGVDFRGSDLVTLVGKLASPWFSRVTLSNARNRQVLRGRGRKVQTGREPVFVTTGKGTRIEPGQTRWQAIEDLCRQAGCLAWSAGDGEELVLGRPNYDQAPQFRFFQPASGSARSAESTVLSMGRRESVGDRYSEIIVVGSGGGTDANYGAAVTKRFGRAVDERDFSAPKRLVIERAVTSQASAQAEAEREMARRAAGRLRVPVRAQAHGQVVAGQYPTIFACDLMSTVEDERTGDVGAFLIVGVTYRSSRGAAEETLLDLVPKGTELAL
jgi:prophage tail gpP-like protein